MASFKEFPPSKSEEIINFHTEEIELTLPDQEKMVFWIKSVISKEEQNLQSLNFIFCSDSYLHKINLEYLNHDTYTDVITFPYSDSAVEGDIFISIDRVTENAQTFGASFDTELNRVIIHGVLHLLGYSDKKTKDKELMTLKENTYLQLLNEIA